MMRTTNRSKSAVVLGALGALAVSLAACSAEDAGAEETDTLTISATGVDNLPFMAMLQAGIDKGWFEEEGVEVSLYSASGGGDTRLVLTSTATGVDTRPLMAMLQAGIDKGWFEEEGVEASLYAASGGDNTLRVVTSGDADMAISGSTSIVLASQQDDSNLKIIAPWFQVNDFSWIAPAGTELGEGSVLGFSSAGSSTELVTKNVELAMDGITTQAVGGEGDDWTAARAGQITAGWSMQPFTADKVLNEGAEVVLTSRDIIGDLPADLVAVNTEYAEANPENLRAFFRAVDRLNEWIVSDPHAAAADLAPLLSVDEEEIGRASCRERR